MYDVAVPSGAVLDVTSPAELYRTVLRLLLAHVTLVVSPFVFWINCVTLPSGSTSWVMVSNGPLNVDWVASPNGATTPLALPVASYVIKVTLPSGPTSDMN